MTEWTFELAQQVLERVQRKGKTQVVFECGFGPSGLPHIGTVAEMLRTRMVIRAFKHLTKDLPPYEIKWILFADDLDALRKVPDTIPEDKKDMMVSFLGTSVCKIPDPWETHDSYAAHNVAELIRLLEQCGIESHEYQVLTASNMYQSGKFNNTLSELGTKIFDISSIITHDYSIERKATYFPFLPIIDGKVIQDIYTPQMYDRGLPTPYFTWYAKDREGDSIDLRPFHVTHIVDGNVKCQWKLDWPMRWMALDVDFEMHGKDLNGSASVGRRICDLMQHEPPVIFQYELFLDEDKQKISKSKGNGLEADEWLNYGTVESLEYFLFQNPVRGRILHWSCIPQYMDMYAKELSESNNEIGSALWHIHGHNTPAPFPVTYNMLLNIAGIADTEEPEILLKYLDNYISVGDNTVVLNKMIPGAIRYYQRFILPNKVWRTPTDLEYQVLQAMYDLLNGFNGSIDDLRSQIFEIGKAYYGKENLRNFFQMLYECLLGQTSGPQIHQLVQTIGVERVLGLINKALNEDERPIR